MNFKRVAEELGEITSEKNKAYGNSFEDSGQFLMLLYPNGLQPNQYTDALLLVRIFDKQKRIANNAQAFGESPYRDIAGYGICGAVLHEKVNPVETSNIDSSEQTPRCRAMSHEEYEAILATKSNLDKPCGTR